MHLKNFFVAVSCGHPKTPHRGRAIVEGITFGQSVSFECDKYYEIEGGSTLTCEADGLWSNISPKCIPGKVAYCKCSLKLRSLSSAALTIGENYLAPLTVKLLV